MSSKGVEEDEEEGMYEELVVSRNFVAAGINGSFSTAWELADARY